MNWIFSAIIFGLIVWNVYLTDDRDYWRDLAESKDLDNEQEDGKLIRMVNQHHSLMRDKLDSISVEEDLFPELKRRAGK